MNEEVFQEKIGEKPTKGREKESRMKRGNIANLAKVYGNTRTLSSAIYRA